MGTDNPDYQASDILAVMRGNVPTAWMVLAHAVLGCESPEHRLEAAEILAKQIIEAGND